MKRKPTHRVNFTKRALEALPVPGDDARTIVFDTHTAGLGFVVFASGIRTFFHRRFVRGVAQRTTLGRFEDLSIDQARGEASKLNARIAAWKLSGYQGRIALSKNTRMPSTFGELVEKYLERHVQGHASHPERAIPEVRYAVNKHLPLVEKQNALMSSPAMTW